LNCDLSPENSFFSSFYYDNLNFDINRFLTKAYAKQIRELNESTGEKFNPLTRELWLATGDY